MLIRDSKGEDVKKIQTKLGLEIDGHFGPTTEAAVIKFQRENGLVADGVVGSSTWSKMFGDISKIMDIEKIKGHIPENVFNELGYTCSKFNITNTLRLSHFLSQCSHESGNFKAVSENLNYSEAGLKKIFGKYFPGDSASKYARNPEKIASKVYADRMGNGGESTGDGYRFRGRGYIQLTGKNNYLKFGKFINQDIISNPDLVATKYPLASAAFFFNNNNIWSICDLGYSNDIIKMVTKRVNGGYNGLDDRIKYFNKYWNLLK